MRNFDFRFKDTRVHIRAHTHTRACSACVCTWEVASFGRGKQFKSLHRNPVSSGNPRRRVSTPDASQTPEDSGTRTSQPLPGPVVVHDGRRQVRPADPHPRLDAVAPRVVGEQGRGDVALTVNT